MSPEERKRWKKLLNPQSDRVQIPQGTIRQFGRLRGAVREGSAAGNIRVPETTPASETNLGRMANALSGVSGLFAQYNDYLFKKDEIAQRGKALEHQQFTEGQKLLQVNQSIAAMGSASQGLDERLKQQEIRNDEIALHNLDLYQNELVADLNEDELTALAKDIQEQGKLAEEGIEKGEQKLSEAQGSPRIREDILRDVRMGRLTGAKLAPVLEEVIAKRWKEELKKIGNRETAPIHSDEEAREVVANWTKEWLEEKGIDPNSDVAWGLRRATQKHSLETLNRYAEGLVTASENRENDDTGLTFSDHNGDANPSAFSPADDDTTHNTVPATPEETDALIKALGDLTPQQEAAVNRELKKEGSELYHVVDALLNPDAAPEDPEEDPEGIGTIGPTSAEIRRGISLAIQAVEKFKGDEELADITNSVAWQSNYAPRPQDVQQSILSKGADHAISAGRVSIQRYLITLDDALEASTWDERNGMDHPVGHDIRNKLTAALQAAEKRELDASKARQLTLDAKRIPLALSMTQWTNKEELKARRLILASLEGNMTNEEVEEKFTEWATRDGIPSPFLESYLTPFKGLGPAERVEEVLKMTTAMINMENNQESLALEFAKGKSWYSDPSQPVYMAHQVKEWMKKSTKGEAWTYMLNTLLLGQKDDIVKADDWADVGAMSPDGMKELNSVIEGLRKDQENLAQGVTIAAQENGWTVEETEDEMKKRMIKLMESVPERLDEWAKAHVDVEQERLDLLQQEKEHREAYRAGIEEENKQQQEILREFASKEQQAVHVDTDGDGEPDKVIPVPSGPKSPEYMALVRDPQRWPYNLDRRPEQPVQIFNGNHVEEGAYWTGPVAVQSPAPFTDPKMLVMGLKTALPRAFDITDPPVSLKKFGKSMADAVLEQSKDLPIGEATAVKHLETLFIENVSSEEANKLSKEEQITGAKNFLREHETYRSFIEGAIKDYTQPTPNQSPQVRANQVLTGTPHYSHGQKLKNELLLFNSGRFSADAFIPFTKRWWGTGALKGQLTLKNIANKEGEINELKPYFRDLSQKVEEKYKRFVTAPEMVRLLERDTKNKAYATRAGMSSRRYLMYDAEDLLGVGASTAFTLALRRKTGLHSSLHHKYMEVHQPLFMGLMYQEGDRRGGKLVPVADQNRPLSREEVSRKLGGGIPGGLPNEKMDNIAKAFGFTDNKGNGDWAAFYASQMEQDVYKARRKLRTLGK